MNTYSRKAVQLAIVLSVAILVLGGAALAQDEPDTLPPTGAAVNSANSYITQLDELRAMSQAQSSGTAVRSGYSVYEYSSDLQRLNEMAAAGAAKPTANDYISRLDELRSMAAD
jgi:hypothetical protein